MSLRKGSRLTIRDLAEKITVRTFDEFDRWVEVAKRKSHRLLIFVGDPGLSKTYTIRAALQDPRAWIHGRITPVKLYGKLYARRDGEIIVLNDTRNILNDRFGVELLMAACETDESATVSWDTSRKKQAVEVRQPDGSFKLEVPPDSFTCNSFLVIITNDVALFTGSLDAAIDRGVVVHLDFTPLEVHSKAKSWFLNEPDLETKRDIYSFVGAHLNLISRSSFRHYVKAYNHHRAGRDWRAFLFELWGISEAYLKALELHVDPETAKVEDKVKKFVDGKHGCRATYFNYVARVEGKELAEVAALVNALRAVFAKPALSGSAATPSSPVPAPPVTTPGAGRGQGQSTTQPYAPPDKPIGEWTDEELEREIAYLRSFPDSALDEAWDERSVVANEERLRRLGIHHEELQEPDETPDASSGSVGPYPAGYPNNGEVDHGAGRGEAVSPEEKTENSVDDHPGHEVRPSRRQRRNRQLNP